jgi:hypothetical protein
MGELILPNIFMNKYWKFAQSAENKNDYLISSFTNGYIHTLYYVPLGICPKCGQYWGSKGEYPFLCPEELKPTILDTSLEEAYTPMPFEDSKKLQKLIEETFNQHGIYYEKNFMQEWSWLLPGKKFSDHEFSIVCHPPFSFMCGLHGIIVKQEVKTAFESANVTGVFFSQQE